MTITLRSAVAGDLMAIGALHQRSRVVAYRDIVPADALAAISADMMGRWWTARWPYERDTHALTIAERDGRLAGFTYIGPYEGVARDDLGAPEPDRPELGELYAIHLDPDEQGHGVGKALMVQALAALHRRGCRRAVLWVLAGNAHARRFYERGGWAPDGFERAAEIGPAVTRQLRYARDLP
jgi:GNAT superfamily N-acetyltransferase